MIFSFKFYRLDVDISFSFWMEALPKKTNIYTYTAIRPKKGLFRPITPKPEDRKSPELFRKLLLSPLSKLVKAIWQDLYQESHLYFWGIDYLKNGIFRLISPKLAVWERSKLSKKLLLGSLSRLVKTNQMGPLSGKKLSEGLIW